MALPNTDIKLSEIYWEAQAGGGSGDPGNSISIKELASSSYFDGPNGVGTITYNAWGQSTLGGANRIYDIPSKTSNYLVGDFRNKSYFYDGSTFQAVLDFNNNLNVPVFPTPPTANDFNITVDLYDSTQTYQYVFGSVGAPAQTSGGTNFEVAGTTPLIGVLYYVITIDSDPQGGGGTTNIDINGTNVFNGTSPSNGAQLIVDFGTYGSVNTTGSGVTFDITFT